MVGIPIRVPFLLVILLATGWIFILAWYKPQNLHQPRLNQLYYALMEGIFCGVAWDILLGMSTSKKISSIVMSYICVAVLWSTYSYYNRSQYMKLRASHSQTANKDNP